MAQPTLLDIAKANAADEAVGLIEEASKAHPELTMGAARTIKGIMYKTLVRTAVPTGGSFRKANEGVARVKGTYENRLVETFIIDKPWVCDKAVADRYEDGASAFIALEASGILEGEFQDVTKQLYYGLDATFGDPNGFPGLLDVYDSSGMVVDAGGTTDDVASSVWAVKWGPKDVRWVWGNGGDPFSLSDVAEQLVKDSGGTNEYMAYVQNLLAYPGLQVASKHSVGRIKKITTDTGKGLTDALISSLLSKFPAGIVPDVLFMSRRSLQQLQASRTATNPTGAPAPFPQDAFGVKIAVTDAIVDIEKLAL